MLTFVCAVCGFMESEPPSPSCARCGHMPAEHQTYVQKLIGALASPVAGIRVRACVFLGLLGDPAALSALREVVFGTDDPYTRGAACEAFGRIGGEAVRADLEKAARHPCPAVVRRAAREALHRIGNRSSKGVPR